MYLVDTTILSATDPTRKVTEIDLIYWMNAASSKLYLSTVTAAEVLTGIAKSRRIGAHKRADALSEWWSTIEQIYADRVLTFDLAAAKVAGDITDRARAFDVGFGDIAIAATAAANNLIVLTENEADFAPLGVSYLNPLKSLPPLP